MGLDGSKALAKLLQVNNRLETIYLDRNFIPTSGFIDIAYALERNFTLKYLPIPLQDVQAAMVKLPERTEAAITKIQEFIRRNNLPQTTLIRNMRLQSLANASFAVDQSLLTKIEAISIQLQQILRSKPFDNTNRIPSVDSIEITLNSEQDNTIVADDCPDDLARVESLLRDAQNVRSLCGRIKDLYSQSNSSNDNLGRRFSSITRPIDANIAEFAKELRGTFETHVVSISELMIQFMKEEFPQLWAQSNRLELDLKDLYQSLINSANSLIPPIEYFQMCLTESSGATWAVKLEQILHTIASQMCNKVLLEISRCLLSAHKLLADRGIDVANGQLTIEGLAGRSSTPDVLRTRAWVESSSSHDSTDLNLSDVQVLDPEGNVIVSGLVLPLVGPLETDRTCNLT